MNNAIQTAAITFLAASASAADLLVPEQFSTIQAAISAAGDGDVVSIASGHYTASIDFVGKQISVKARFPGTVSLASPSGGRAVLLRSNEGSGSRISGIRFVGASGNGGGVLVAQASPTIEDCTFDGIRNGTGGAILVESGAPRIQNCRFESCTATDPAGPGIFGSGGAIRAIAGNTTIVDCFFSQNRGDGNADAIMNEGTSRMNISRCIFGAQAGTGSVIYNSDYAAVSIRDCEFRDDPAIRSATLFSWGQREIVGCRFRNLRTVGAVVQSSGGATSLSDCEFRDCVSSGAAAGINGCCSASFVVGGSFFCGMLPAAIGSQFVDQGGIVIEGSCAPDADSDGVSDLVDNCPTIANPSQSDCNSDAVGDACELASGAPDFNGDAVPDGCQCLADIVLDDRQVNGADLGALLVQWGPAPVGTPSDLDRDGSVDGVDLAYLLYSWGACAN